MYSEALIEKVAHGIFTGTLYGGDDARWVEESLENEYSAKRLLYCVAQDVLDALGLREELGTSALTDGRIIRYVTAWEYS